MLALLLAACVSQQDAHLGTSCLVDAWNAVSPQFGSEVHTIVPGCRDEATRCPNFIEDGGGDMFDRGNRLFVRSDGEYNGGQTTISASDGGLSYHTACGADLQPAGVGDIQVADADYSACLESTLFAGVFSSASGGIGGFRVEGDLGADGRGDLRGNSDALVSGRLLGFYKSVHSAYSGNGWIIDQSINHLIITTTAGAHHTWDSSGRFDHDDVSFTRPTLSGAPGGQVHLHTPFYQLGNRFTTEECADDGHQITSAEVCREAAVALGFGDVRVEVVSNPGDPPGCFEPGGHEIGSEGHIVRFNTATERGPYYSSNGPCAHYDICICQGEPQEWTPSPPASLVYYLMWGGSEEHGSTGGFSSEQFQLVLESVAATCPLPPEPSPPPPSPSPSPSNPSEDPSPSVPDGEAAVVPAPLAQGPAQGLARAGGDDGGAIAGGVIGALIAAVGIGACVWKRDRIFAKLAAKRDAATKGGGNSGGTDLTPPARVTEIKVEKLSSPNQSPTQSPPSSRPPPVKTSDRGVAQGAA